MHKPSVKRALLAVMVAEHRWGSPIVEENLQICKAECLGA